MMETNAVNQNEGRPASHKWAIFVMIAFLAVNGLLALRGAFDVVTGIFMLLCLRTLIGFVVSKRSRRTYLLGALTLALVTLRAAYYGVAQPAFQLLNHDPRVRENWFNVAVQAGAVVLLILLFRAYTFGAASRAFYGYPAGPVV